MVVYEWERLAMLGNAKYRCRAFIFQENKTMHMVLIFEGTQRKIGLSLHFVSGWGWQFCLIDGVMMFN